MEQDEKAAFVRHIPSMRPYFPEDDIKDILSKTEEVLRSGRLTLGIYTEEFEKEFARYVGVKHAIAANSGTCTLEMIYRALDIAGREVVVPTNTHIATSNAVIYAGGSPILADIEEDTLCLDLDDAFARVSEKTRAMVVVHIAGLIHPRIDVLRRRCKDHGIVLIEDAAHAQGATINGRKAGSLSQAASFSFYPAKVITSVEGGMITTDDDEIDSISRQLRNHGNDAAGLQVRLGYNWRMSELHSIVGLVQLRRIEEIIERKTRVASTYKNRLVDQQLLASIETPTSIRNSYYKFPVSLSKSIRTDYVQNALKKKFGIDTGTIYYPPCHLQPIYLKMFGTKFQDMPVANDVLKRTISLPISADMDEEAANYVADALLSTLRDAEARY